MIRSIQDVFNVKYLRDLRRKTGMMHYRVSRYVCMLRSSFDLSQGTRESHCTQDAAHLPAER